GATPPPHCIRFLAKVSTLSDARLLEWLIASGGVPDQVARYPDFLRLYLPTIRADLRAYETFDNMDPSILDLPIWLYQGRGDPILGDLPMIEWTRYCRGLTFRELPHEGHFFVQTCPDELIADLVPRIRSSLESSPPAVASASAQ